jgi:signal transduction histidine kinase
MLNEGNLGPLTASQSEALRQVKQAARGEVELIAAMLDVSRIEAGKLPVHIQAIEPQRLLEEIKREVAPALERSGLTFQWRIATDLGTIQTDRPKLKIILKNLVDNAIKFTDTGSVTIDVFPRGQGVVFSVQDTGEGIAPEVVPIIFDMFRQGDSSMTRRHEGVGLGLYIVQRMLKLLGGTVEVESARGQGSTFRVWIPTHQQSATKEQS